MDEAFEGRSIDDDGFGPGQLEKEAKEPFGAVKVGAVWLSQTKAGNDKLSISLGDRRYFALKNRFKSSTRAPDYVVYERK